MIKTTGLFNVSRPKVENSDSEIIRFDIDSSDEKFAKKSRKLSKSKKKLSKIGNFSKFDSKKARLNFLTFNARKTFNYL